MNLIPIKQNDVKRKILNDIKNIIEEDIINDFETISFPKLEEKVSTSVFTLITQEFAEMSINEIRIQDHSNHLEIQFFVENDVEESELRKKLNNVKQIKLMGVSEILQNNIITIKSLKRR